MNVWIEGQANSMTQETGSTEFYVILDNRGNPDFGQDPTQRLPGTKMHLRRVNSLNAASLACREYITENYLGGGNWSGGAVRDAAGTEVARVSYNGKVWPPGDWTPDSVPLFDPSAK
jgi:hypothetical protein